MALEGTVQDRVGIPDGAVVHVDLEIVGYFDEDGLLKLAMGSDSHAPLSTIVGLIEQTKFVLLRSWDDNSEFEDE